MNAEKAHFLRHRLVSVLQHISTEIKPTWGNMTLQQMIKHFACCVCMASGKTLFAEVSTPPEQLDRLHDLNFERDVLLRHALHYVRQFNTNLGS